MFGGRAGCCLLRTRGVARASLAPPALALPFPSCAAWTSVLSCNFGNKTPPPPPPNEVVEKRGEIAHGWY